MPLQFQVPRMLVAVALFATIASAQIAAAPIADTVDTAATATSAAATSVTKTAATTAASAKQVAAPWPVPATLYAQAPEPWRSYLAKAREADAIIDPMQRCLAFPAFPGSNWPANLIPAHCEYTFGLDLSLDKIKARLDANDLTGLEAIFRKLQERHFSDTDFSEHIHSALELFGGSYEAGAISKRWLDAAPDSPFAMTARAEFYRHMGWAARGGGWAPDTPKEQLARMHEFHDKARALYQQALEKEPRLMHAHAGLVDLDMNGARDTNFDMAYRIDPACKVLLSNRMSSLEPRWSGSYEAMAAQEEKMLPYLPARPLLALSRIWSYIDQHDVLYDAGKYPESMAVLKPMVAVSSGPKIYEDIGAAMAQIKDADRWEELAYLVQSTRFRTGAAWAARERGRLQLLQAHDMVMADASLAASLLLEPEDYYTHYLRAAALSQLGRVDEAERDYLVAMRDKPGTANHRDGLIELANLMVFANRGDKARSYAKLAVTEYPNDAGAWLAQVRAIGVGGSPIPPLRAALETFLAKVDPNDARFRVEAENARKGLEQMRAIIEKDGGKW